MEYNENTIDNSFWEKVFHVPVQAGPAKRIGEGQVGMNLRFALESDAEHVPNSVVVKLASPDPTSRATGIALRNYEREVKFYNEIAESLDVRMPHCYFADWHEDGGDIAIVLEDMSPCEQGDQIRGCGVEEARLAVGELSRLHGPRWNDPTLWDIDWIQRRGAEDAERMHGMYAMFKTGFLDTYTDAILRETGEEGLSLVNALESLMPKYVMGRDEPYTVTHGDYRLDNLLFATPQGGVACAVVDWQTPGHGNGVGDLSYFIGAGLLPSDRQKYEWELVDLYIEGLESYGHAIDHAWVKNHYKRESFAGLVMAVIASQIVGRTDRGDKMFEVMATRHIQQAIENDALSLL